MKRVKIFFDVIFLILKFIFYDVFWNALLTSIKGLVFVGFPIFGLYVFYEVNIETFTIELIGIYVLTPLAILLAFSGLFYNRARTVNAEDERSIKNLRAAEYTLRGSIYYSFALVWGFSITSAQYMFQIDGIYLPLYLLKFLYIPSFLAVILAYIELYFGLAQIWKGLQESLK